MLSILKYKNPGMLSVAILFIAFSFNDWYSLTFGFPTPIQLAIVFGIYNNLRYRVMMRSGYNSTALIVLALLYLFIVITYTIMDWSHNPSTLFVSIGFNLFWLLSALPLLSIGIEKEDWRKLCTVFLLVVSVITIPSGYLELFLGRNILDTRLGLSDDIFYLRGLHIDKLEFGSILSLAGFIAFVDVVSKDENQYKPWKIAILALVSILLVFSFSTTSMLGFGAGICIIMLYMNKKYFIYAPLLLGIGYLFYSILQNTSLYHSQQSSYELKYKLNVEMYDQKNFRYLAIEAAEKKIEENLFFGYGVGQSGKVIQELLGSEKDINTHNFIGNELLDYGLLGFTPLFVFIVLLIYLSFKVPEDKTPYLNQMNLVVKAVAVFLLFRFFLYYHRFDQAFYVIWAALVVTYIASINNQSVFKNEDINMR